MVLVNNRGEHAMIRSSFQEVDLRFGNMTRGAGVLGKFVEVVDGVMGH